MSHRQNPKFQRLFESSRELELSWLDFLEKSVGFTKYSGFFSPPYMYFSFIVQENLHKTEPIWIHVPTEIMDQIATKAQLFPSCFGDGPMGLKSLLLQRHWCAREKLLTCFFAQQGALANHASRSTNDLCYSFVQTNKRNVGCPFETRKRATAPSSWRCF